MAVPIEMDEDEEVKGDMTPMIDIIFLLLVFFILTTKFIVPERVISSLLPTDKGQMNTTPTVVEQPDDVNLAIYPQLPQGLQPSQYDQRWKENVRQLRSTVWMDAGGSSPRIEIQGKHLSTKNQQNAKQELDKVFGYVSEMLQERDEPGVARKDQPAVVIHCFCGLPWKYAMAAYDAVRRYEGSQGATAGGAGGMLTPESVENLREVDFAPPRIRNYHQWALGYEIWEIMKLN